MNWRRKLQLRFRALFQKRKLDAEVDEEMRLHIEMQTQENLDAGMNPEEARYAALRQFGWVESIKETCREQRGCVWIEGLARDLRYATRLFRKHPLSNSVIMMTIALLIGAVSVIYASLREQRARLLPFPEPERLVKLWRVGDTSIESLFPADLFQEYRSGLGSFAALGALEGRGPMTLTGEGEPVAYQATGVSASVLQLAGTPPLRGRLFDESDELPGADRVAIISEQVWRGKLGADEGIIGRTLLLNDKRYTVVAVMPEWMRVTHLNYVGDIWLPSRLAAEHRGVSLILVGRLKPTVTPAQAQAELDVIAPRLEEQHAPDQQERAVYPHGFKGARVTSLDKQLSSGSSGVTAGLILVWTFAGAIIGSVVGIACFNITNLLLARVSARSREIAIRLSLGAGPRSIVRQLIAETVVVSLAGGLLGLLAAFWFCDLLRFQRIDPRFDWRIYLIASAGAAALGALTGLLPAWRSSRTDLTEALKDGGQSVGGQRRHRLRNLLVSSEVAMASLLCVVAGVMIRAYLGLAWADPGFDPERLLIVTVQLRTDTYGEGENRLSYVERGLESLREMPGVETASVSADADWLSWAVSRTLTVFGTTETEDQTVNVPSSYVSHEFPVLFGMPVLRGRGLSANPAFAKEEALVNESLARKYFSGRDPVGHQISVGGKWQRATIVGVTRDRHLLASYQPVQPEVFLGLRHASYFSSVHFVVRTKAHANAMAKPICEVIARLDASQPVNQPVLVASLLDERTANRRGAVLLLAGLAAAGLFIALTGIYGIVAASVVERTREVGIRIAVGAGRSEVLRLLLWQGAKLILIGAIPGILAGWFIMLGLPGAPGFGGDSVFDTLTGAGVILVIGSVGLLATFLPARRATKIDPMARYVMNDLKFAFRQLLKNPGFTAVAMLTLALGIGSCAAMFSVVRAVLLRPLPFAHPDRLVWIENTFPGGLKEFDPTLPSSDFTTLERIVDRAVAPRRTITNLLGGFSSLAFVLASIGLYGVIAYSVGQRTHEIGIRVAIGAQRSHVLRLIVGEGLKMAMIGVASGLIAAWFVTRVLKNILFGVSATDPFLFAINAAIMIAVAALACWLPARRATKVDPMEALRYE